MNIIFFSGCGHIKKQAENVYQGALEVNDVNTKLFAIDKAGNISENEGGYLEKCDSIIFSSSAYKCGSAWHFKKFTDVPSEPLIRKPWRDKISADFTNLSAINSDKFSTILYLQTSAMRRYMIWTTKLLPSNQRVPEHGDISSLGEFGGTLA